MAEYITKDVAKVIVTKAATKHDALMMIDALPTVDTVQVVHGHWIDRGYLGNDNRDYMCSVCGAGETHTPRVEVRYCWNCGARMDEECDNDNAE